MFARLILLPALATACSNWLMSNDYMISGRTMDLGPIPGLEWSLSTSPRGTALHPEAGPVRTAKYGIVGIVADRPVKMPAMVTGGLNEAGLSCDEQTLITTDMPPKTNTSADVNVEYFCQWALSNFASTDEVRGALLNGSAHIWGTNATSGSSGLHHSLRDAEGRSAVVEYVDGETHVYQVRRCEGERGMTTLAEKSANSVWSACPITSGCGNSSARSARIWPQGSTIML